VGDMLPKLAAFRTSLQRRNMQDSPLFFAKVDVQSCFDTIPHRRLLSMMDSIMSMQAYRTGKHVEISPIGALQRLHGQQGDDEPAPIKRYVAHGSGATEAIPFNELVDKQLTGKRVNTVFVDTNMQRQESKAELMHLLCEHVERNMVQMGKRFYRQKTGIPQGSILSTILCNLFYAELERDVLGFTLNEDCLLLRLLDDFLLISTSRQQAERFVRVMHEGHAEYGVTVQASKSVTNFDVQVDGGWIGQCEPKSRFVYCGMRIDTRTLEVSKHGGAASKREVEDSLTVDLCKVPGQTFHRKALNAFKIQLHGILVDTALNGVARIWANLHRSFYGAALRCIEYVGTLARMRKTRADLVMRKSSRTPRPVEAEDHDDRGGDRARH
jgi:telomerase reverse transcriptase